jgi:hypothetical protein
LEELKMVSQPLSFKACPEDETAKANSPCHEKRTKRPIIHACQNIAIFAAIAYSATYATAFSTGRNSIIRNISSQKPITNNPAFITNTKLSSPTAIFATKKEMEEKIETKSKSEREEWEALLAAFQMYKAAYGDLKVPSRFVVPSMPPWPGEYYSFNSIGQSPINQFEPRISNFFTFYYFLKNLDGVSSSVIALLVFGRLENT